MNPAIALALALLLAGCMTEPEVKTRDHTFDCVYLTEADSTVTPTCTLERK